MADLKVGVEHLALVRKLQEVLLGEPDVVKQQVAIELLAVAHAMRMQDEDKTRFVLDHMHRHMRQMMGDKTLREAIEGNTRNLGMSSLAKMGRKDA